MTTAKEHGFNKKGDLSNFLIFDPGGEVYCSTVTAGNFSANKCGKGTHACDLFDEISKRDILVSHYEGINFYYSANRVRFEVWSMGIFNECRKQLLHVSWLISKYHFHSRKIYEHLGSF